LRRAALALDGRPSAARVLGTLRRPSARLFGALLVVALLAACASTDEQPTGEVKPLDCKEVEQRLKDDPTDVYAHYLLAHFLEDEQRYEQAIEEYGAAINLTERGTLTTPTLDLGKLHQRLGNLVAAERLYREVLGTFPADTRLFKQNPDYKDAALGLKPILEARGDAAGVEQLGASYVADFGGTKGGWDKGPPWMKKPGDGAPVASATPAAARS